VGGSACVTRGNTSHEHDVLSRREVFWGGTCLLVDGEIVIVWIVIK
jgi:hypothetical protein